MLPVLLLYFTMRFVLFLVRSCGLTNRQERRLDSFLAFDEKGWQKKAIVQFSVYLPSDGCFLPSFQARSNTFFITPTTVPLPPPPPPSNYYTVEQDRDLKEGYERHFYRRELKICFYCVQKFSSPSLSSTS